MYVGFTADGLALWETRDFHLLNTAPSQIVSIAKRGAWEFWERCGYAQFCRVYPETTSMKHRKVLGRI